MKKIHYIILACVFTLSMAFTAANVCSESDYFIAGTFSKMEHYDAKNKLTGTSESTVKSIRNSGDSTIASIESVYLDEKGKEQHRGTVNMSCVGQKIVMDMKDLMRSASQNQGKDMTMTIEGNFVEYTPAMTVGETLPEVNMVMKSFSNGSLFSTMNVHIYNRKVEAKESKTTKAGTFDCYKISSQMEGTMSMAGMNMTMNIPGMKERKSVEWFSFKAGAVRMESYKGDKLESSDELVELKKP